MGRPLIEGCVDPHASALFRQVRRDCPVPVNVPIRPRFGGLLTLEEGPV